MTKLRLTYENGTNVDESMIYDLLVRAGRRPSEVIPSGEGIFECRYSEHAILPSDIRLKNLFKKGGLEVKSLEVVGSRSIH